MSRLESQLFAQSVSIPIIERNIFLEENTLIGLMVYSVGDKHTHSDSQLLKKLLDEMPKEAERVGFEKLPDTIRVQYASRASMWYKISVAVDESNGAKKPYTLYATSTQF